MGWSKLTVKIDIEGYAVKHASAEKALVVLSFAAIYLLWGGTFLAIRVAVLQIPPLFTAGIRFCVAGMLLVAFARIRGVPNPSAIQWRNLSLIGVLMFALTYGPLFWAQQYVPSGLTSIIEATLPITTIALEMGIFRTLEFQWRAVLGVLIGFSGVALLLSQAGTQDLPLWPCLVILLSGLSWSFGTVMSGRLALPDSRPLTAGAEMLIGGAILLGLSTLKGDFYPLPHISTSAALALLYLIVFGSLIAYTAYVWLLARLPATRVASHAYINPLVAVALGYFVGGEVVTMPMVIGAVLVVGSVFLTLTSTHRAAPAQITSISRVPSMSARDRSSSPSL
jgi:drug/metabolite transporter (DMT)-like permease